jgi:hypothetical protein
MARATSQNMLKIQHCEELTKDSSICCTASSVIETLPALANLAVRDEVLQAIYTVSKFAKYL